jgi:hypothetical protein
LPNIVTYRSSLDASTGAIIPRSFAKMTKAETLFDSRAFAPPDHFPSFLANVAIQLLRFLVFGREQATCSSGVVVTGFGTSVWLLVTVLELDVKISNRRAEQFSFLIRVFFILLHISSTSHEGQL